MQDVVFSHYLHRMDIHALRNDPNKSFFNLKDCDASSAQGVEQNHLFCLDLCATLAGATYPMHSVFKAGPVEKKT